MSSTAGKTKVKLQCPRWIHKLLGASNALQAVEKGIEDRMDNIGILIPRLWEHSMSQLKQHYPTLAGLNRTNQNGDVLASDEESDFPPSPRSSPPKTPALKDSCALSSPSSPPPYPPLRDDRSGKSPWEPQEDDYVRYLLQLKLPREAKLKKFQQRFGSHRTPSSLMNRFHRLRSDRQERAKWSFEESEHLAKILQTKTTWQDISNQMQEKFGINRSEASLRWRVKILDLEATGLSNAQPWTDEEDSYLKLLWEIQVPMKEQWRLFRERFNNQRSEKALAARRCSKGFGNKPRGIVWPKDEADFIRDCISRGLGPLEMCENFWKRFGRDRSEAAIVNKLGYMKTRERGIPKSIGIPFSAEEIRFLRDSSLARVQDVVAAFSERFGTDRTRASVRMKLRRLRNQSSTEKTCDT